MQWISTKTRIAIGLVSIQVSVVLVAMTFGVYVNPEPIEQKSRATYCETVALTNSFLIAKQKHSQMEEMFTQLVKRNRELRSIGFRNSNNELKAISEGHPTFWGAGLREASTDTHVMVPVSYLDNGEARKGTLEFAFRPFYPPGLFGFFRHPVVMFMLFLSAGSMLTFLYYLGATIRHLDPSKTVPNRVRNALDTLVEGLVIMDPEGRIIFANSAFENILGLTSENFIGKNSADFDWLDETGNKMVDLPWIRVGSGDSKEECCTAKFIRNREDGQEEELIFKVQCTPVGGRTDEDGSRGVLCSFEDITLIEKQKEQLADSKKSAEVANKAKSEFLANMSHEIRTPMNAILGFTELLRRGTTIDNEERDDYLNTIHSSGTHLLELINDILDLSKIEAGKLELETIQVSPFELIGEVINVLRVRADEKGIGLEFKAVGNLPAKIETDPVRLRQVVTNLIGNAIKFTDEGQVLLEAELLPPKANSDQQQIEIRVIDSGIGMTESQIAKIFDPFSQADSSVTRRFGGTGLGLSISQKIAKALGGSLRAESTFGSGSTFIVQINTGNIEGVQLLDNDAAQKIMKAERQAKREATSKLPPCNILVVDDGDANRKLMNLVLSRAGACPTLVENGQEALDTIAENEFDLVLMDMQMPVMDGYTATRELRKNGFEKPIFALTANAMKGDEEKCIDAGCSGFLSKPINIENLLSTLASSLVEQGFELPTDQSDTDALNREKSESAENISGPANRKVAQQLLNLSQQLIACWKTKDFATMEEVAMTIHEFSSEHRFVELQELTQSIYQLAMTGNSSMLARYLKEFGTEARKCLQTLGPEQNNRKATTVKPQQSTSQLPEAVVSSLPMDDPEFREIVAEFVPHLGNKLEEMKSQLAQEQFELLQKNAHWLKGAGGTIGFDAFYQPSCELEQACKSRSTDSCQNLLQLIDLLYQRIELPDATPA